MFLVQDSKQALKVINWMAHVFNLEREHAFALAQSVSLVFVNELAQAISIMSGLSHMQYKL